MRPGHLPGPRRRPSADQRPPGDRVVRRPKRPAEPGAAVLAADAGDPGHLDHLVRAQRRQQRRKPLQGERLAPAGRPDQQQAVRARRGDLEAAAQSAGWPRRSARSGRSRPAEPAAPRGGTGSIVSLGELPQLGDVIDRQRPRARRPARPGRRHPAPPRRPACPTRWPLRHRQGAGHGPDRAVERELARQRVVDRATPRGSWPDATSIAAAIARSNPGPALRRSAGARLAVIRCCGCLKPELTQRGPHPLARLPHRGVGQPDDRERRQPAADVHLHVHGLGVHPDQGEGAGDREHGATVGGAIPRLARGTSRSRHALVARSARAAGRRARGS